MSEKQGKMPTGRVNYIWVMAGMYLLYLAYKLFGGLWKGDADRPWVNVVGGLVFAGSAMLMFLREWRAYQYGKAHIDDPETWSDEFEEEEQSEEQSKESPEVPPLEESPADPDKDERKEGGE